MADVLFGGVRDEEESLESLISETLVGGEDPSGEGLNGELKVRCREDDFCIAVAAWLASDNLAFAPGVLAGDEGIFFGVTFVSELLLAVLLVSLLVSLPVILSVVLFVDLPVGFLVVFSMILPVVFVTPLAFTDVTVEALTLGELLGSCAALTLFDL